MYGVRTTSTAGPKKLGVEGLAALLAGNDGNMHAAHEAAPSSAYSAAFLAATATIYGIQCLHAAVSSSLGGHNRAYTTGVSGAAFSRKSFRAAMGCSQISGRNRSELQARRPPTFNRCYPANRSDRLRHQQFSCSDRATQSLCSIQLSVRSFNRVSALARRTDQFFALKLSKSWNFL